MCEVQARSEAELGLAQSQRFRARFADVVAVNAMTDLPAGLVELHEDGIGKIDVGAGIHLQFQASHPKVPRLNNGCVDWANVTQIKLLEIERSSDG